MMLAWVESESIGLLYHMLGLGLPGKLFPLIAEHL